MWVPMCDFWVTCDSCASLCSTDRCAASARLARGVGHSIACTRVGGASSSLRCLQETSEVGFSLCRTCREPPRVTMSGFGARPAPSNTGMMWTGSSAAVPDEFGGVISSDCFVSFSGRPHRIPLKPQHPLATTCPAEPAQCHRLEQCLWLRAACAHLPREALQVGRRVRGALHDLFWCFRDVAWDSPVETC